MDTRQLAAFCAVVERRSFSQAAERLGVTQPAVSACRSRAREAARHAASRPLGPPRRADRGGTARSTAARSACSRSRSSCSTSSPARERASSPASSARRVDRAGRDRRAAAPLRVPARASRACRSRSSVSDTQSVVERVAERELELGIVGAARRHRAVRFEPFFEDEVILACPPGHRVRRADGLARRAARARR